MHESGDNYLDLFRFRQLKDYLPQLDDIAVHYERVLYKPHPYCTSAEIADLMANRYMAENCDNKSIYEIFVTENIHTVCAISSSVLTEAPYFGVQSVFLEPRAKRWGPAISYRALLDDACFWEVAFLKRHRSSAKFNISSIVPINHVRRTFSSWGFVTDEMRVERRISQAESKAQQAESMAQQAEAAAKEILLQLNAVYASTSWRVTAPLRAISRGVHSLTLAPRTIKSGIKQGLRSCATQVARRPRLKRLALVILNRMPTLKARLKQVTGDYRNTFSSSTHQPAMPLELHQLSPRARQIYADLKSALAKRQGEK